MNNPQLSRKEEISKGCGKVTSEYPSLKCGNKYYSPIANEEINWLCPTCQARLDERIRAEQDFLKELDLDKVLSENKHLPYGITEKVLNHIKSKIKKQ